MRDWSSDVCSSDLVAIGYTCHKKNKCNHNVFKQIICNNLACKNYFVVKAVGWALHDYSLKNPSYVKNFLEQYQDQMNLVSFKEASKYLTSFPQKK